MNDTARPRRPPRFLRHRHEWRDLGAGQPGDWRYRCTVCRRKSRNPFYQHPEFRRWPLRDLTQALLATDDRKAFERRIQRRRAR